jgi:N-acetylglucosaminyldiphosphoundecaprenol N-acetyl-beta-D-mannosaminyltransferase
MTPAPIEKILLYDVTTKDTDKCVNQIVSWIAADEKGRYLVCANPHSLEVAKSDRLFREAILHADLITPDGVGMVVASRILGGRLKGRVTGSDIFLGLSAALNGSGRCRYFFLGSTQKNLNRIKDRMAEDFPGIEIAGTHSPPFKEEFTPEEDRAMVEFVNQARPHVLWVGMTAPKQEKWVFRHKDELDVGFIGAIGAAFDFYTGAVKRSSTWFQAYGLEWLPRMLRQPGRLWYRNFVSNPKFLMRVILQRLSI